MQVRNVVRVGVASLVMMSGLVAAAPAGGPVLAALARIQAGQWQFKSLDTASAPRTVCLGDARVLIQYGHSSAQCQHAVVTNSYDVATVQYACPGTGHGQTSVKVATQTNFNIETQGILSGAPFDEQFEARRLGDCPSGASRLQ
jgi:hypothetical protein